jgi:hypothetical protein
MGKPEGRMSRMRMSQSFRSVNSPLDESAVADESLAAKALATAARGKSHSMIVVC